MTQYSEEVCIVLGEYSCMKRIGGCEDRKCVVDGGFDDFGIAFGVFIRKEKEKAFGTYALD